MAKKFSLNPMLLTSAPSKGQTNIVIGMARLSLLSMRTKTKCWLGSPIIGDRSGCSIDGHLA